MTKRILLVLATLILFGTAAALVLTADEAAAPRAEVTYLCRDGREIIARYSEGPVLPPTGPGEPPRPTGRVELVLGDSVVELAQTISADGARYASADESLIFWSRGNRALMLEDGEEHAYVGCARILPPTERVGEGYRAVDGSYTLRYPRGYTIRGGGARLELLPPSALREGTNLGSDTKLIVEKLMTEVCTADRFISAPAETLRDGVTIYSVASSTDAAAGNRYEHIVYAIPEADPCIAVRYVIHSGVIENYPEGTVRAFDRAALLESFDAIRRSLVLAP